MKLHNSDTSSREACQITCKQWSVSVIIAYCKQGHVLIFVWILCFFYDLINYDYPSISQWCINLFMTILVVVANSFIDISVVFNLLRVCISVSVDVFAFE